jgi:hypothetical protein
MTEVDLPKLTGLPANLHQMVAVSDAVNRDAHPFTLDWDDEAQHKAILEKMQGMARAQLAAYGSTPATKTPTPAPAVKKTTPTTARSRRPAATPAPQTPLLDEDLKAYTLSYGGAATYIYSANTGGTGAALRYVTIVAQDDGLGNLKPAIQSVTDAAHFNRSPKMQFVDVVDADASSPSTASSPPTPSRSSSPAQRNNRCGCCSSAPLSFSATNLPLVQGILSARVKHTSQECFGFASAVVHQGW